LVPFLIADVVTSFKIGVVGEGAFKDLDARMIFSLIWR